MSIATSDNFKLTNPKPFNEWSKFNNGDGTYRDWASNAELVNFFAGPDMSPTWMANKYFWINGNYNFYDGITFRVIGSSDNYIGKINPDSPAYPNPDNKPIWGDVSNTTGSAQTYTNYGGINIADGKNGKLSFDGISWSFVDNINAVIIENKLNSENPDAALGADQGPLLAQKKDIFASTVPAGRNLVNSFDFNVTGNTYYFGEYQTFVTNYKSVKKIWIYIATLSDFRLASYKLTGDAFQLVGERVFTPTVVGWMSIDPTTILLVDDFLPIGTKLNIAFRNNTTTSVLRGNLGEVTNNAYAIPVGTSAGTVSIHSMYEWGLYIENNQDPFDTGLPTVTDRIINLETSVIGTIKTKLVLPKTIFGFVGFKFQIFKDSILNAYDTSVYNIQAVSSLIVGTDHVGDDMRRYWEYTPTAAGTFTVTFNVYNNFRNLIDSKIVTFNIKAFPASPATMVTVVVVGDSLVWYGRITDEFIRVLTSNDPQTTAADTTSTNTVVKFAGKGLTNIQSKGGNKVNQDGWVSTQYNEGHSGWTWADFIGTSSPFYFNGSMDFAHYLTQKGITEIKVMPIFLGWNDIVKTQTNLTDNSVIIEQAKTFLRALHTQLPATKVVLVSENMPGNIGGEGMHPYGSDERIDVQALKIKMCNLIDAYIALSEDAEFSPYVSFCGAHAMFDSQYMLRETIGPLNSRVTNTERKGLDDVHPSDAGFFQMADALIAHFANMFL